MDFLWFLLIGAVAGAVSGQIMRGRGFGCLGNIIVGVIGAAIGGFVFPLLGLRVESPIGPFVSATVGALLFLVLLGVGGRRRR